MSLQPQPIPAVPEETARVARAAFPKGTPYLRFRDAFGRLSQDVDFAALFPRRGQPAASPWRLALVLVLQYAEGLTDRPAAAAVRSRLDWKYLLSLELADPGFDASVLSAFRTRLVAGSSEARLLERLLEQCQAQGLLTARGRQRTDSTAVLAAIRHLNRLELVGETLRHTLNSLAVVAPEWLQPQLEPEWAERSGARLDAFRLPKGQAERETLAGQIGRDGQRLLTAVLAAEAPAWLREVPAVETLRQVWLQPYQVHDDGTLPWRPADNLPPAAGAITSPYDLAARSSTKRTTEWTGYTVQLTETCEPEEPHRITAVQTTPATTPDHSQLPVIQQALAAKGLLPAVQLVDAGYPTGASLVEREAVYGVQVLGPVHQVTSWQAQQSAAFDARCFQLDWSAQQATCPAGHTSIRWTPSTDHRGHALINIQFAAQTCQACALRPRCTTAQRGRRLGIRPQAEHEALQAARQFQTTPAFTEAYRARAGVEGTISQGVRRSGLRRARYRGLAKTRLQHLLTAAALNVVRVIAWLEERPLAPTRRAPVLQLMPQAA